MRKTRPLVRFTAPGIGVAAEGDHTDPGTPGRALARHGDFVDAIVKFGDANTRGPHWADPLKAWGDVLAKQGHTKEALAIYDAALIHAPNWKQLKEACERAAKHVT
jgi:hypothetical protein